VQAKHSWNANWIATSAITFRLQRHADHHLVASRPYQVHTLVAVVLAFNPIPARACELFSDF
jgi:hypothetical protein